MKKLKCKILKDFRVKKRITEVDLIESQKILPYLPTSIEVIDAIFKKLNLPKDSLVYDLGSGDGRIIFKAITEYGLKGIGFEIDKTLISEAKNSLKKLPK
ncbi:MAG: hypothetical protein ACTSRZ_18905 [Promethearchaeota archaeon]